MSAWSEGRLVLDEPTLERAIALLGTAVRPYVSRAPRFMPSNARATA